METSSCEFAYVKVSAKRGPWAKAQSEERRRRLRFKHFAVAVSSASQTVRKFTLGYYFLTLNMHIHSWAMLRALLRGWLLLLLYAVSLLQTPALYKGLANLLNAFVASPDLRPEP